MPKWHLNLCVFPMSDKNDVLILKELNLFWGEKLVIKLT